ncbi:MAG: ribosomal-protein-alanine N-acetyltransferase [Actinobacteria bacterium]|uniref:Unannotated protein n=1 Tax=freshwater metagenome TaxID=449393 RepID=A0A6J5ZRM2_9ZZZZ|nr:ribosomal-protein-alanine N-acetyltransferase [Actinomycetota bacterium]
MSATMRPMTSADLDVVMDIERELFGSDAWSRDLFQAELDEVPATRRVMVACVDDTVVGYVSLRIVPPEADVNTIAVAVSSQRQGIALLMMKWLISQARADSVRDIFLDVRSDNSVAIALYDNLGFQRIDKRKNYYGNDIDALVMRLRLTHHEVASS